LQLEVTCKKTWAVELTSDAEKRLREDFKSGFITQSDIKVIKRWIADIEDMGLVFTQHKSDWRDHELDGEWQGHRAISFSYAGRVIYRVLKGRIVVQVVRVTADHDYKK
jgi:mRNA-degrading endonuclease YafQ of YafQ-DinJ toxin-antitoxin module